MNTDLVAVIDESGVEKQTGQSITEAFLPFIEQAEEWKKKAESLVVTSAEQKEEMKQAREARLILKNLRVQADKKRKALKEDSLKYGKAVQGVYNFIDFSISPIERHLKEQEDFVKIQEAKRKEQLKEDRLKALEPFDVDTQFVRLDEMTEEIWNTYYNQVKTAHEAHIAAEQKLLQERMERERIQRLNESRKGVLAPYWPFIKDDSANYGEMTEEEFQAVYEGLEKEKAAYDEKQEAIRKENERLRLEAEAEKERQAKIEAERKAKEEKERKEREKQAKKEREAHEAALKKEREERARIEAEIKAKEEAEAKARQEALEAERKAQLAPDKDKLLALADKFEGIDLPEMSHPEAAAILAKIKGLQSKLTDYIREQSNNL